MNARYRPKHAKKRQLRLNIEQGRHLERRAKYAKKKRQAHCIEQEERRPELNQKEKFRLPLGVFLAYLLVATTVFMGVSFSKFATSRSISDGARVAIFAVEASASSGQTTSLSIDTGAETAIDTATYAFYVTNTNSEVAISYTISVALPKELPSGIEMSLIDAKQNECEVVKSGNTYKFTGTAPFNAGVQEKHSYTLKFTAGGNFVGAGTLENVKISVMAEQID